MVILIFAIAGLIISLGFLGDYLFKRTGIPDILLLIFFGFLLGPFFNIIDPALIAPITPILASLALLIILFDGGLNLSLHKVLRESSKALLLGVFSVIFSMIFTALFMYFFWNWTLIQGLLLGTIIGGTSSSVVIPLINRMKAQPRVTTILCLESAFTDAMVIVVGIALLGILTVSPNGNEIYTVAHGIASAFSIGAMVGLVTGIIWLRVLKNIQGGLYDDILTLSIVLLLFSIVESLGGNGAIFALTFGLVLGNGREISKMLRIKEPLEIPRMMRKFMSQISFFIRTFFFMYIGLLLVVRDVNIIYLSVLLSGILLGARIFLTLLFSSGDATLQNNRGLITVMIPRGLAAAILAQLVWTSNITYSYLYPEITIIVIISTVVFAAIGSSLISRSNQFDKSK